MKKLLMLLVLGSASMVIADDYNPYSGFQQYRGCEGGSCQNQNRATWNQGNQGYQGQGQGQIGIKMIKEIKTAINLTTAKTTVIKAAKVALDRTIVTILTKIKEIKVECVKMECVKMECAKVECVKVPCAKMIRKMICKMVVMLCTAKTKTTKADGVKTIVISIKIQEIKV